MYTVKYKRGILWKKLEVKGDGYLAEIGNRYFILEDDSILEVPANGTLFYFSPERAELVKENGADKN